MLYRNDQTTEAYSSRDLTKVMYNSLKVSISLNLLRITVCGIKVETPFGITIPRERKADVTIDSMCELNERQVFYGSYH